MTHSWLTLHAWLQTPYPRVEQQWLAAQWRRLEAERTGSAGGGPDSPTGDAATPVFTGGERLSEAGSAVAGKAKSFLKAGMKKGVAAVRARMGGVEDDAHVCHPPSPLPPGSISAFIAASDIIVHTMLAKAPHMMQ